MKDLFNKTFFHFTLGFLGILLFSFALAAVVTHLDSAGDMQASVGSK